MASEACGGAHEVSAAGGVREFASGVIPPNGANSPRRFKPPIFPYPQVQRSCFESVSGMMPYHCCPFFLCFTVQLENQQKGGLSVAFCTSDPWIVEKELVPYGF